GPPNDIERPFPTKTALQGFQIFLREAGRIYGLLPRERERGLLGRRESRPVALRQTARSVGDVVRFQARDREQHLTVAHSVEAVQRAGNDPKQRFLQDAILED